MRRADHSRPTALEVLFDHSHRAAATTKRRFISTIRPRPGRYVLRVSGIKGSLEDDQKHWVSFDRPHGRQTVGFILGILFSGILFIMSLIFFLWRVIGLKLQD